MTPDAFATKLLTSLDMAETASERAFETFARAVDELTPMAVARVEGWEDDFIKPRLAAAQAAYAEAEPRIRETWDNSTRVRRREIAEVITKARPAAADAAAAEVRRTRIHAELAPAFEGGHGSVVIARYNRLQQEGDAEGLFMFAEVASDLHQVYPETLNFPGLGEVGEELREGPAALREARDAANVLQRALTAGEQQFDRLMRIHQRRPTTALRIAQATGKDNVWALFSEPKSPYDCVLAGLSETFLTRAARAAS